MSKSKNISKTNRLALKAEQSAYDQSLLLALKSSRKRFKKFDQIIEAAYNRELESNYLDERIEVLKTGFYGSKERLKAYHIAFKDLLIYLVKIDSKIIKHATLIKGVHNLCAYKSSWIVDYKDWKPKSNNADNQFNELVTTLFCKYLVPSFLYNAWLVKSEMKYINWFVAIASGISVRKLPQIPIKLTKKIAFYFINGSDKYNVNEVLRWAQVKGLGGDEVLARRIVASRLGYNNFANDQFWEKFILILINAGMFNYDKIGELIDYLQMKIREDVLYNLKGRTFTSLLRQSDEWHRRETKVRGAKFVEWRPSELYVYTITEGKKEFPIEYTFVEMLSSRDLAKEGKAMHHCVGSYTSYCLRQRTAIFSLRKSLGGLEQDRMATIEVNLASKRIVQAKYKYNKPISGKAKSLMTDWAAKNCLIVSPYL